MSSEYYESFVMLVCVVVCFGRWWWRWGEGEILLLWGVGRVGALSWVVDSSPLLSPPPDPILSSK